MNPKPYYQQDGITIYCGKSEDVLPHISGATAVVTDPPAGIAFMGKEWDKHKGGRDKWIEWMSDIAAKAINTLPPGGIALVWALPRTSHWTATAWENAGWEVRDVVTHIFGSGFPKSLDISKAIDKAAGAEREVIEFRTGPKPGTHGGSGQYRHGNDRSMSAPATESAKVWEGYGTALKPAVEFWHLLQKPVDGTYANNAIKHGVAGINVDGARIGYQSESDKGAALSGDAFKRKDTSDKADAKARAANGRFPANLILSGDDVAALFPETTSGGGDKRGGCAMFFGGDKRTEPTGHKIDTGSASRFFQRCDYRDPIDEASRIIYTAKASGTDRGNRPEKQLPLFGEVEPEVKNTHPTVKPLTLMEYLIKLVTMPAGTVILDPFGGSGSTAVACKRLGVACIMIEQDEAHCRTAVQRLGGISE